MTTGTGSARVKIECTEGSHYAPEGWDDVEVAICPRCSQTVRWNAATDTWDTDTTLRVLVLEPAEAALVTTTVREAAFLFEDGSRGTTLTAITTQLDLQEPLE